MSKLPNNLQKQLDNKIFSGYSIEDDQGSCDVWLEAWEMVKAAMDEYGIEDIEEFDREFNDTSLLYNWSSELEMALANAGLDNPDYLESRIAFCSEYIARYGDQSEYNILHMKSAIAESHFKLGRQAEGERLFEEITRNDPDWSWGWISWSDMYWLDAQEVDKDSDRAVAILKQGLEEVEAYDDYEILIKLQELYMDLGMVEEALAIEVGSQKQEPVRVTKIGRNELCPCGSGKKYKKCCLGRD
jgi:tetratricopeptide (TPR) repeat protein